MKRQIFNSGELSIAMDAGLKQFSLIHNQKFSLPCERSLTVYCRLSFVGLALTRRSWSINGNLTHRYTIITLSERIIKLASNRNLPIR